MTNCSPFVIANSPIYISQLIYLFAVVTYATFTDDVNYFFFKNEVFFSIKCKEEIGFNYRLHISRHLIRHVILNIWIFKTYAKIILW